jgi:hypothetical protein
MEEVRRENNQLKVSIGLLRSDNLILHSKLTYSHDSLSQRDTTEKENICGDEGRNTHKRYHEL